ncbi:hypothetical protein ACFT8W_00560 [Streptomyces hygroscopicus]
MIASRKRPSLKFSANQAERTIVHSSRQVRAASSPSLCVLPAMLSSLV